MLESFPAMLAVGTLLGFLTGLGIGGGSLLILWLTMVLGVEPLTARSINLLFFIPAAVIACLFRLKSGILNLKKILPAIAAGCAAAGIFSWLSTVLEIALLKKGFGLILVIAGARELLYQNRNSK